MDLMKATKQDFQSVPYRTHFNDNIGEFSSLVIIPTDDIHDSGYRCMDFVALDKERNPICRLSGCSDVLHIDGIGGYGKWQGWHIPQLIPPKGWSIDCLPCGYLRLFIGDETTLIAVDALSSFEVFGIKKARKA